MGKESVNGKGKEGMRGGHTVKVGRIVGRGREEGE